MNDQLTYLPSLSAEAVLYRPSGNKEGGSLTVFKETKEDNYVPSKTKVS